KAMKLLFDKKDGIGFQWVRIPIGASDYALKRYTLNDSKDDFEMNNFSITRDKEYLIPYIKAAQAIKPDIHFWASPWTPPPWMKKNAFDNEGYDGGEMKNDTKTFDAHALYFSKFIEAYKGENIPIDAVCPQNEPGYERSYPTCGWGKSNYENKYNNTSGDRPSAAEYLSTFVANHLYPKLKQDHPKTEIWFGTLSNDATAQAYWDGMKSKDNSGMIKGLGLQWNNLKMVSSNTSKYLVFCSEHQCGNYYWKTEVSNVDQADSVHFLKGMAPNNFSYGVESWGLIRNWITAGTHLYSAWNMVLDTKGLNLNDKLQWPQNALLVVDRNAKTLKITPYYYVVRHICQYVDSGAVRIQANGGDALAFQNPDGSLVTIVHNPGTSDAQTTISVSGKNYSVKIPKKGWATLAIGLKPVGTKEVAMNRINAAKGLKVTSTSDAYKVSLPSQNSGRVELLSVSGRVLESRSIPQGCSEVSFSKQASHSGMLLVRVINGAKTSTVRFSSVN
ncbi:MAG TPA: glycoside hydrolase family 30 protein, partial [Chitinispirillaceae bacterium]|nr:glycoside hydrolase family 30 protein [Chitinispirillaceae bacterium]